jgi:hypothetical protein
LLSRCVHDVKLAQLQHLVAIWVGITFYAWFIKYLLQTLLQTRQTERLYFWHGLCGLFQLDLGLDLLED